MLKSQWIIENHQNHCAKVKFLKHQIEVFQDTDHILDRNGLIESLSGGRRVLDGMPHGSRISSRTENAVMHLESEMEREKRDIDLQIAQWKREVEYLEYLIGIYDVLFNMVSEEERLILQLKYEKGMSVEQIASQPLAASEGQFRSESTIRRMVKRIFNRLDELIAIQYCA